MKKECIKYQSMVEGFLQGKISGFEKQNFVEHIKKCKVCHEELEIYHVIYSVIDELEDDVEPENSDYMASLEKKLNQKSRKDLIFSSKKVVLDFLIVGITAVAMGIFMLLVYGI